MALPLPIGRQKEVLRLPARGHFAVLGTAGSGKTTLAILRSAFLADPQTDHGGRTLLVTFNRALVHYLKHLQNRHLSNVVIENYHRFARGYLASRQKMTRDSICGPDHRTRLIRKAIDHVVARNGKHPLLEQPPDLVAEELRWIAMHGIPTADQYRTVERVGRAGVRITRHDRTLVFDIYQRYLEMRRSVGKLYDWDDIATAVCHELAEDHGPRRYRHIVIDEGQDFSPEMLRSLAQAVCADGSLTFFGDMAQQIYGHRMSWRSAGLNISKVWEFTENYRNTRQIAGLAVR